MNELPALPSVRRIVEHRSFEIISESARRTAANAAFFLSAAVILLMRALAALLNFMESASNLRGVELHLPAFANDDIKAHHLEVEGVGGTTCGGGSLSTLQCHNYTAHFINDLNSIQRGSVFNLNA